MSGVVAPKGLTSPGDQPLVRSPAASTQTPTILDGLEAILTIEDRDVFFQESVAFVVGLTGARSGFLYSRDREGKVAVRILANRPGHEISPGVLPEVDLAAGLALNSGQNQRITLRGSEHKFAALCVPFRMQDEGPLALVLLLGPERAPYLDPVFTILQLAVSDILQHTIRQDLAHTKRAFLQATLLVDLFARVSGAESFHEAMSMVAAEMQEWLGCERLAIATGPVNRLRLGAISGITKLEKRSHGNWRLLNLMKEALSDDSAVIWPEAKYRTVPLLLASDQGEMLTAFSVRQAIALPLKNGEGAKIGAWCLLWKEGALLTERHLQLIDAVSPHLASLAGLLQEALPTGLRGKWRQFLRRASKTKRTLLTALPFVIAGALITPVPHWVRAKGRLTPDSSRQVAAPINGMLEEVFVKPGDTVEKGDQLAMLDGKEIGWRLAEAIAKRGVAAKRKDQARAVKDVPATQLAQFEEEALTLEVELLRYQQNHLEITAPIDGLILSGDLERSRGVPVSTGQKLFEIAALDRLRLEAAVSDEDVHWVEPGMKVQLRLESRPSQKFIGEIEEIYPVAEVQDGENVFIALTTFENEKGILRPGMRGRARIISSWKPLGWVLFHKPWNYLRLRFL